MRLYMAVTADAYELPLMVEDTAKELARKLDMTLNAVLCLCSPSKLSKNGKRRGFKIVRVTVDEEPEKGNEP